MVCNSLSNGSFYGLIKDMAFNTESWRQSGGIRAGSSGAEGIIADRTSGPCHADSDSDWNAGRRMAGPAVCDAAAVEHRGSGDRRSGGISESVRLGHEAGGLIIQAPIGGWGAEE